MTLKVSLETTLLIPAFLVKKIPNCWGKDCRQLFTCREVCLLPLFSRAEEKCSISLLVSNLLLLKRLDTYYLMLTTWYLSLFSRAEALRPVRRGGQAKRKVTRLLCLFSWLLCLASCYLILATCLPSAAADRILKQPTAVREVSLGHQPLSPRRWGASGYHILRGKL